MFKFTVYLIILYYKYKQTEVLLYLSNYPKIIQLIKKYHTLLYYRSTIQFFRLNCTKGYYENWLCKGKQQ